MLVRTIGALSLGLYIMLDLTVFLEAQSNISYSVIAPKSLRSNSTYVLSVTTYNSANVTSNSFNFMASLKDGLGIALVSTQIPLQIGTTNMVSLSIPDKLPKNQYTLFVTGSNGLSFQQNHTVWVSSKALSLFIQTDKAIYKPGQTVLFRAIGLYSNLKPYKGPMDITVYDNAGNKIIQMLQKQNDSGVVAGKLVLSDQTPLGQWQIKLIVKGDSTSKNFQVAEYVLPKFEVTVDLPSYFLVNLQNRALQTGLPITVSAKYTYGEPVKGTAVVEIQLKPYEYYDSANYTVLRKTVELNNGKADLSLTMNEILRLVPVNQYSWSWYTQDFWSDLSYRTLRVVANVTETLTGIVLSGNNTVDCKSQKCSLTFLDISPTNYKPGLLYNGYLQLAQSDQLVPLLSDITDSNGTRRNINVTVTCYYISEITYRPPKIDSFLIPITDSGYMMFSYNIGSEFSSASFQADFNDSTTNTTISAYKSVDPFKSRDQQGIQLMFSSSDGTIKPDTMATFYVNTTTLVTSFQYELLAKGIMLLSNTVNGVASTNHQFSVHISSALAIQLAPTAQIVVSCVTNSGEVVADSLTITVTDSFANPVSLSFNKNMTEPSTLVNLTVNAYQGSYVALLAVDQSVLLLGSGNDLTQDMIQQDIKNYGVIDSSSSNPPPEPEPMPMGDVPGPVGPGGPVGPAGNVPRPPIGDVRRKRCACWWWPTYNSGVDSYSIIDNAGLFILTDAYIYHYVAPYYHRFDMMRPLGQAGPEGPMADAPPPRSPNGLSPDPSTTNQNSAVPRVNFPETWIWTDVSLGENGQATITATVPDTITSWVASAFAMSDVVGIGIANSPAKITVFKQFFVSLNLPYSIIRGEEFALQITIFNYLTESLSVVVSLPKSTYFKVRIPNGNSISDTPQFATLSQTLTVNGSDAVSTFFWIVPVSIGQIPIEVSAFAGLAADAVRQMLLVKPEGTPQQYSTSTFIQLNDGQIYNESLIVSLPPMNNLVPGSTHIEVTAIGDVMGSSLNGLSSLLQMPCGCGEQNMIYMAPDIYVMEYLSNSNQLTSDIANKNIQFMTSGYQRELTYQRSDGSFSAFGNQDESGSTWLSSFVIKCFHQAKDYIPIEDDKIGKTLNWIMTTQAKNGSFQEVGRVIHTDMQGGSSGGVALTAFVLIALLENRNNSWVDGARLNNSITSATQFLEIQLTSITSDAYALSIFAYALMLAKSPSAPTALSLLEALAINEGGLKHWEATSDSSSTQHNVWMPPYQQSRSVNIEITSYALLIYATQRDISRGLPIAKWLIKQRNALGGFSSTQDTVMALEALAMFSSMLISPSGGEGLTVTVTGDGDRRPHIFDEINAGTSLLLQSVELPDNTTRVLVAARGNGVGLVQLNVQYNVYTVAKNTGLDVNVNTNRSENEITLTACSKWLNVEQSGMVVMEINQLTGYSATNTDDFYNQMGATLKRIEQDDNKIVLYFDQLNSTQECIQVKSEKVQAVNNVQNATVKVYRYYDPSGANLVFYSADEPAKQSWCDSCPQCCDNKVEVQTTVGSDNGVTTYATNVTTSVSVLKMDGVSAASHVHIFYHITIWALVIVMKFIN